MTEAWWTKENVPNIIKEWLQMPSNFALFKWRDPVVSNKIGKTWSLGPVIDGPQHTLIDESNLAVLMRNIETNFPGEFRRCPVGEDSEYLNFHLSDDGNDLTPIAMVIIPWSRSSGANHILDEQDFEKRAYDRTIEGIRGDAIGMMIDEVPEDWAHQVHDWFHEFDKDALSCEYGDYPSPEHWQIVKPLIELGYIKPRLEIEYYKLQLDMLHILKQFGVQSYESMTKELFKLRPLGSTILTPLHAVFDALEQLGLIKEEAKNALSMTKLRKQINSKYPGAGHGTIYCIT